MSHKRLAVIAVVAAAYAGLTLVLAPIAYGPIQFRVSEALKALVLFRPDLALAIGLGTAVGNLASPYVGAWELVWMPLTDFGGGVLAAIVAARLLYAGALLYAVTTAAAVALMLTVLTGLPFGTLWLSVLLSEAIIIVAAVPVMRRLHAMLKDMGY